MDYRTNYFTLWALVITTWNLRNVLHAANTWLNKINSLSVDNKKHYVTDQPNLLHFNLFQKALFKNYKTTHHFYIQFIGIVRCSICAHDTNFLKKDTLSALWLCAVLCNGSKFCLDHQKISKVPMPPTGGPLWGEDNMVMMWQITVVKETPGPMEETNDITSQFCNYHQSNLARNHPCSLSSIPWPSFFLVFDNVSNPVGQAELLSRCLNHFSWHNSQDLVKRELEQE